MEKHFEITRQRLKLLLSPDQLPSKLYSAHAPVDLSIWRAPGRVTYAEALRAHYKPATLGTRVGPAWTTCWFRVELAIPRQWRGCEVHFRWDSSSEACVWMGGQPVHGLAGTGVATYEVPPRPVRTHFVLTRKAAGGERISLHVETACNHLGGIGDSHHAIGTLTLAEMAVFDRAAWDLLCDYTILAEMAEHVPRPSTRGAQALWVANEMVNLCDLDDRTTWPRARKACRAFLAARNGDAQHHVSAIGHAHIDTAWLWPLAETKRKCYRTFSTALATMEEYPEFKFACSQAQQLDWMKKEQPALYRRIKKSVRAGSFVPVGGTWIEPDCNIPSGESLVRQFLFGQRFFEQEFGRRCTEFWNPDVFGYSAQLPQIMRGAGIERFLTQKLSWNQFNKPQSHTFWWEGLDGSRVLTHFPPADNYSSYGNVREMVYLLTQHKDLERTDDSLFLFGYGDGGGGPVWGMLENLRRMRDLDGLPRVEQRTPEEFFRRLEAGMRPLTVQRGELYFEAHRGTYTTQAQNKLLNRRSEELLHDIEFLATFATGPYPKAELEALWKLVLLNQFHDIIPGSSIAEVHAESRDQYNSILVRGAKLRAALLSKLILKAGKGQPATKRIFAVNSLGFAREEIVETGGKLARVKAPAMGFRVQEIERACPDPVSARATSDGFILENRFVTAAFDKGGHLKRLIHRHGERVVIDGGANHFVLFDDVPLAYDAWDVDVYHLEKRWEIPGAQRARLVTTDPLRATIEFEYELSRRSRMTLRVSLDAISPRLDFACMVDWHEKQKFLKVEFPTLIQSESATYEIQFGHVKRPTTFNNSHELAQFEVSAHRWADLSEPGCGLALLNDCKYGYAVHGRTMRLSLLRSPTYPDKTADIGRHHFRYALIPHAGDFRAAGIVAAAVSFNSPLLVGDTPAPPQEHSFLRCSDAGLVIDTVKKAEDSDAVIVRLYEAHGSRGKATLHFADAYRSACQCNLLEDEVKSLRLTGNRLQVAYGPFEVLTIKLRR